MGSVVSEHGSETESRRESCSAGSRSRSKMKSRGGGNRRRNNGKVRGGIGSFGSRTAGLFGNRNRNKTTGRRRSGLDCSRSRRENISVGSESKTTPLHSLRYTSFKDSLNRMMGGEYGRNLGSIPTPILQKPNERFKPLGWQRTWM